MAEAVAQLLGTRDALLMPLPEGASVREAEVLAMPVAEAHAEGALRDCVGRTLVEGVREDSKEALRLTEAQAEGEAPACVAVRAVLALGGRVAEGRGPLPETLGEAREEGGLLPLPQAVAAPEALGEGVECSEALLPGDCEGVREDAPLALVDGVPVMDAGGLRVLLGCRVVEEETEAHPVSEGRGEVERDARGERDARALLEKGMLCEEMTEALEHTVAAAVALPTVPVAAVLPDLLALGQLEAVGLALGLGDSEGVKLLRRLALAQAEAWEDGELERERRAEAEAESREVPDGDAAGVALAVPLAPPPGLRLPPPAVPVAQALSETTALALPLSVGERDSKGLAEAEAQALVDGVDRPERVVQAVALAQALMLALKEELEDTLGLLVLFWDAEVLGVRVGCRAVPVGAPGVPLLLPHCVGVAEREKRALRLAKGQGLAEGEGKALPLLLGEPEMQLERLGDGEGVELLQGEGEALGVASGDRVPVAH